MQLYSRHTFDLEHVKGILALLCAMHSRATVVTQASVVRPSVVCLSAKPIFSEAIQRINVKFWEDYPSTISPNTFFF